jgi:tRNA modification GTPase
VLLGPPNIGKSSLFNALVGRDAALVADEAGTTRDWIEARLEPPPGSPGAACLLVDLAGVTTTGGAVGIDAPAQAAAHAEATRADVVVACQDAARPEERPAGCTGPRIDVRTRCDRQAAGGDLASDTLATSSRTGMGVALLRERIHAAVAALPPRESPATVRMRVALDVAREALRPAVAAARRAAAGIMIDEAILAADLRAVVEPLGEVTGVALSPDLIERIFSRHCIGK